MTRHLLKLVWNRKRTTALVMVEIAVAFLVLFSVVAFGTYVLDNWRRPVGFTWDRVWDIEVASNTTPGRMSENISRSVAMPAPNAATGPAAPGREGDSGTSPAPPPQNTAPAGGGEGDPPVDPRYQTLQQLMLAIQEFPEIEASAVAAVAPFGFGGMVSVNDRDGQRLEYGGNEVTDAFADVLGLRVSRGRWFSAEDRGQAYRPVVINQDLAREVFGDADPVGRPLIELDEEERAAGRRPTRIVGVVDAYREDGEFDGQRNFEFNRKDIDYPAGGDRVPRHVLVRVRPGTTAQFEEKLVRKLQAIAPDWSFEVRPLSVMHEGQLNFTLLPLAAIGTIAASLLVMVGLGLLGVLWQTVTQRTREIGLRRAKGAARRDIARQILAEIAIMATLALIPAVIVALQVPLLGPFYWVEWHVYAIALAISLAAIYVLAVLCGWYPARLAAAVQPADALRYE
jgi:putative ABC transport system permease protein